MRSARRWSLIAAVGGLAALIGGLLTPGVEAAAPTTDRVSVSSSEGQGNGSSEDPSINEDARFVAFESGASNLVGGDGNGSYDVFVRDRNTGATEIVSVNGDDEGDADSRNASISPEGRFVGFDSDATNLVSGDANGAVDVFVRDRGAGTTELVSVSSAEVPGAGASMLPSISSNGNRVAFQSVAPNLVTPASGGDSDIFVRDRSEGTTVQASVASDGTDGSGASANAAISSNGGFVAFDSAATNLVDGDTNGDVDVFLHDLSTGTTIRVSVGSDGTQANGDSTNPSVSGDGRFVAFQSAASNLVPGDTNGDVDVFVHDRLTGVTKRVSVGSQADGASTIPSVGALSPTVAFQSAATNLVSGDTNGLSDVFTRQFFIQSGYYVLDDVGGIFTFGGAEFFGSVPALRNAGVSIGPAKAIDLATTPTGEGYYVLDEVGGIFTFGDAEFFGSLPGRKAAGVPVGDAPIIDIAATATGDGYYILDAQGGVHTFGDATFHGSLPGLREAGVPVGDSQGIDLATNPAGDGYFILDNVGGIFTFGDAEFKGSVPGLRESGIMIGQAPSIRLEVTATGGGYLVLDSVGGIFSFGDADFHGSVPGLKNAGVPIGDAVGVDIGMTPGSGGYLILDNVGGIFTFGDATFLGSVPSLRDAGVPIGPADSIRLDVVAGLVGD